jgi:hypothetical protein
MKWCDLRRELKKKWAHIEIENEYAYCQDNDDMTYERLPNSFVLPTRRTEVYKINEGYGYSVFLDNQPLIIQTHIPAIANKKAFCTYEDALNTSNIVKNKLKARLNPSVTIDELKHIDVMFSCDTLP